MISINLRRTPRGRLVLPLLTGGLVALLLGAVAVTARLSASPDSGSATADDKVFGLPVAVSARAVPGAGVCVAPNPLTPRQLRSLAHQPVIEPTILAAARPAGPRLQAAAQALTAGACDHADGAYAYVQLREWVIGHNPDAGTAVLQDEHWLAADGSGRSTSINTREPASENPPSDDTFPPGASVADPAPLSADPGRLTARLDSIDAFALGPQSPLRALADVNQWHTPSRGARAAALLVLSRVNGLIYHGEVTDRAGRPGIAVAALSNNGAARDLVILDEHTGELLAYEHTALRDPGKLGITRPTVLTYTLYVTHTHTDSVQQR